MTGHISTDWQIDIVFNETRSSNRFFPEPMDQSHGFIPAVGPTDGSIDSALTDLSHFCALTLNEYLDGMPKNDRIATGEQISRKQWRKIDVFITQL